MALGALSGEQERDTRPVGFYRATRERRRLPSSSKRGEAARQTLDIGAGHNSTLPEGRAPHRQRESDIDRSELNILPEACLQARSLVTQGCLALGREYPKHAGEPYRGGLDRSCELISSRVVVRREPSRRRAVGPGEVLLEQDRGILEDHVSVRAPNSER